MQIKRAFTSFVGRSRRLVSSIGLTVAVAAVLTPALATVSMAQVQAAAPPPQYPDINQQQIDQQVNQNVTTNFKKCPKGDCIFTQYVNPLVNALAAMVGIAVTISIIYAGIRYASSADNPQKVSEAKQRIVTSLMVLIGFFTFYAFLNYIIPGGLVGGGGQ